MTLTLFGLLTLLLLASLAFDFALALFAVFVGKIVIFGLTAGHVAVGRKRLFRQDLLKGESWLGYRERERFLVFQHWSGLVGIACILTAVLVVAAIMGS